MSRRKGRTTALTLLAGLFVLLLMLTLADDALRSDITRYVVLTTTATLLLYLGYALLRRCMWEPTDRLVLYGAVLLRLAVFPLQPDLSDDAWRYIWDGRLVANGISPYGTIPADPALDQFHDDLFAVQGYPETPTIYPPGAQLLFAAAAATSGASGSTLDTTGTLRGYYGWKLLLLLGELVAIFLLLRIRRLRARSALPILLYAWHPLAIVEIAGQGHTDGIWVLALALAFYGYVRGTKGRGLAGLSFGTATRIFPALVIPLWFRYLDRRAMVAGVLASVPFALLFLVFVDPEALSSTTTVGARFTNFYEFNGGVYQGVKAILDAMHVSPSNEIAGGIVTGTMLAAIAAVILWPIRQRDFSSLLLRSLIIITLQISLTAKVHVWYGVAPLALIVLEERVRMTPVWLWLALTAPLTYLFYAVDPPSEPTWVLLLEWGGAVVMMLAAIPLLRHRSRDLPEDDSCEKV